VEKSGFGGPVSRCLTRLGGVSREGGAEVRGGRIVGGSRVRNEQVTKIRDEGLDRRPVAASLHGRLTFTGLLKNDGHDLSGSKASRALHSRGVTADFEGSRARESDPRLILTRVKRSFLLPLFADSALLGLLMAPADDLFTFALRQPICQ
jgi:hypothetical protein